MVQNQTALEAKMTPAEKALYEKWRAKIGQVCVSQTYQEAMNDGMVIYFYGLGKEASPMWIRMWATVNRDYNALWFDLEYAERSRWGGLTAPPLYLICVNDGLEWAAIEFTHELWGADMLPNTDKYPNFSHTFQADSDWEFFEPVRPEDTINAEARLADLYWKQGKEYRMLFIVGETSFTNQKGQAVGKNRSSAVYLFK